MRAPLMAIMLAVALTVGAHGQRSAHSELPQNSAVLLNRENPCPGSALLCNHDGTFEINGCAWVDGGVIPPYYGAFAEGFDSTGVVCGMQFAFTTLPGFQTDQLMDVYVWDSDGANPTTVLGLTVNVDPGPVAIWEGVSLHDVDVDDVVVDGPFFVGFWGNWPGAAQPGWWVAADFGGVGQPRTYVAPGMGLPTGWQPPYMFDGRIRSLGICAYLGPGYSPVEAGTWGAVKALFSPSLRPTR
jgi:hypothetical protein